MTDVHLKLLREACLKVADTLGQRYNTVNGLVPVSYDKKSPLEGYCTAVACMVQGMFGGDIVTGRIQGEPHYWNRLSDGREVDLTSCQFGGDGFTPFKKGRKVKSLELTPVPVIVFAELVRQVLQGN